MPTPTYDLIASNVLTTNTTSVTFSSLNTLASGYRDLIFVITGANTTDTTPKEFRLNSDSGSNYSSVFAFATGSGAGSEVYPNLTRAYMSRNASALSVGGFILQLFDFQQTDKHKSFLCRARQGSAIVEMTAGRWASTSAVTSIEFGNSGADSWIAGTTFYVYGVAA